MVIWSILECKRCAYYSFVMEVCNLSICLNLQLLLIFQMASMAGSTFYHLHFSKSLWTLYFNYWKWKKLIGKVVTWCRRFLKLSFCILLKFSYRVNALNDVWFSSLHICHVQYLQYPKILHNNYFVQGWVFWAKFQNSCLLSIL